MVSYAWITEAEEIRRIKDYFILDVETTGLNTHTDKIIAIGAVRIKNGVEDAEFSELIDPGRRVPEHAAQITGINTKRVKRICYTISGLTCGLAAVFLLGYEGAASLKTGEIYTFNAICAAVIGGAALSGGHGDAAGTFLGCIFMQLIMNGIYKLNLPSEYQTLLVGAAIIIMSTFNTLYTRWSNRRLRELGAREDRGVA